jgi:histone H3/H4
MADDDHGREQTIQRLMKRAGMPRDVAEEAVDEADAYVDDWARQIMDYHLAQRAEAPKRMRKQAGRKK